MPSQLEQWVKRTYWMDGCDVDTEYRQARDEGRDLSSVEDEFARLHAVTDHGETWLRDAGALVDRVQSLPYRADYPYHEPSDLDGIRQARPDVTRSPFQGEGRSEVSSWSGTDAAWLQRLHGGLLGRICGCMLGKPIEGWHRAEIKALGEVTENWPLTDYLRMVTSVGAQKLKDGGVTHSLQPWQSGMLAGGIDGMVEDDDTNYTTIGYAIVRKHGKDFTPLDVAAFWCDNVPILHTCTAERVAYRNFVMNVLPPDSRAGTPGAMPVALDRHAGADEQKVNTDMRGERPTSATVRNPYREWIGAQIRADYFGYANPGNPERAAEWAWRDASISHIKNGIYGEMWVAAMLAAAYVEDDWRRIVDVGLAQIPANCRLRKDVDKILNLHASGATYDDAVDAVHTQWDEKVGHHWCHTNSNAQLVVVGLLYGEDDYETTITRAVMPGFDTDCNGATCGSLWGIKHGLSALPSKWTTSMNDKIRTGVAGYYEVAISKLANDMLAAAIEAR